MRTPRALLACLVLVGLCACESADEGPKILSVDASITSPVDGGCVNPGQSLSFVLDVARGTPPFQYQWSTSPADATIPDPDQLDPGAIVFPSETTYIVSVEITDRNSTRTTPSLQVVVRPGCVLSASIDSPADGTTFVVHQEVAFEGSAIGGTEPFNFHWTFDDSGVADSAEQNPTVKFESTGFFAVALSVTDQDGTSAETSIAVEIGDGRVGIPVVTSPKAAAAAPTIFAGAANGFGHQAIFGSSGFDLFDGPGRRVVAHYLDGVAFEGGVAFKSAGAQGVVGVDVNDAFISYWNDKTKLFDPPMPLNTVGPRSISLLGNDPSAPGFLLAGTTLQQYDLDGGSGRFQLGLSLLRSQFPGMTGAFQAAFAEKPTGGLLVVGGGSPGQLFVHSREAGEDGVSVGELQNQPQELRCLAGICVATNGNSNSVSVATWDGETSAAVVGHAGVGLGPDQLDLKRTAAGIAGAVLGLGSVSILLIDGEGTVTSNWEVPLPTACDSPAGIAWIDGTDDVLVTCSATNVVFVLEGVISGPRF